MYVTVSDGIANHFASPIPLTPLQHLFSLAPSLLSPYTINIHLPSFPIIFSFALLYSIPPFRLPTVPNPLSAPSLIRHLSITSNASKVTSIAVSDCHYIKTLPTLDRLYSSIDNFKLEGLIRIYLRQKSISLASPS